MTKLDKPLTRLVDFGGNEIAVTLVPADAGLPPCVEFREKGHHRPYRTITIDPPVSS